MKIKKRDQKTISSIVASFSSKKEQDAYNALVENIANIFKRNADLMKLVHSIKYRVKDIDHLRDKLERKAKAAYEKKKSFSINLNNYKTKIEDLAGVRILHLYTRQFKEINRQLKEILRAENYTIKDGPVAMTWDEESRKYFKELGAKTEARDSMYTSVHFVVINPAAAKLKFELQVRTLAEEIWGEVTHTIDYPHKTESRACQEQIKVLARATSSCSRLVDSLYVSHDEFLSMRKALLKKDRRKRRPNSRLA